MKVLVTGATGFVGQAIVSELIENQMEVYCLGSLKSLNKKAFPNFRKADIKNFESLKKLDGLENIDVVIHSAGLAHQFGEVPDEAFLDTNVLGTKNISQIAVNIKAKHFILISSVAVYGKDKKATEKLLIDEQSLCKPETIYAKSKLEAENTAGEICEKSRIPLTILRLATVIGENDRGNTARLIKMIDKRKFIWIGKGENLKSLIYKNDVAAACLDVLKKKTGNTEIFNVTSEPVSMKEIVSVIAAGLNRKIPRIFVPALLLTKIFQINTKFLHVSKLSKLYETIEKWLSDDIFSGEKIAEKYGFRARTPIAEAIQKQVETYKLHK